MVSMKWRIKLKPTKSQLDKISDISISLSQVLLASVLIDPLVKGELNWTGTMVGLVFIAIFWTLSIRVVKNNNL